jgi:mannose-6-phosphate isomerase-like protein (cupin superfamily)
VQGLVQAVDQAAVVSDRPHRTIRRLTEHPALDATWSRYGPGEAGPDPHVHHRHVDAFYVIAGELRFGVGPRVEHVHAAAGTVVLVPPNVVHAFDNASDAPACWLNFHAPSTGFMAYLRGDGSFDSHDPPADGGVTRDAVVVSTTGAGTPQLSALVVELPHDEPLELPSVTGELEALYVIEGELDTGIGAGAWIAATPEQPVSLRCRGSVKALRVRAPVDRR